MSAGEVELIAKAARGDRAAFDELVRPLGAPLAAYVRRMVGHPEDTRDLVQDTLLAALQAIAEFRGQSAFKTWLFAIATRRCLDYLKAKRRWTWDAQERVRRQLYDSLGADGVKGLLFPAEYRFDAHEHIAFCFSCVSRSLEPLEQAALVLSEVVGATDREAASALELSESVLRHRLSDARHQMHERFEGLCALVNKQGVCRQCIGLRQQAVEERRGPPLPDLGAEASADTKRRLRLAVVRDADIDGGRMQPFHDTVWRALERLAMDDKAQ